MTCVYFKGFSLAKQYLKLQISPFLVDSSQIKVIPIYKYLDSGVWKNFDSNLYSNKLLQTSNFLNSINFYLQLLEIIVAAKWVFE